MRFTLTLDLGGDAMQTPHDVSIALANLAGSDYFYRDTESFSVIMPNAGGVVRAAAVRDTNGNTVGRWHVTDTDAAQVARIVLAANLAAPADADASDLALSGVEYTADRVRIMLVDAAQIALGEVRA